MTLPGSLRQLAQLFGVETSYQSNEGTVHTATPEALVAVLRALGAPVHAQDDADQAWAALERHPDLIEPVLVAWDGVIPDFALRLRERPHSVHFTLALEDGAVRAGDVQVRETAHGLRGTLAEALPFGYHDLSIEAGRERGFARVIAAPRRAHGGSGERAWGVFLPLYAVRSEHSLGIADYSALGTLAAWAGQLGGSYMGTLPLLASFLDRPYEPSPYAPASRLFWNEIFLQLDAAAALVPGAGAALSASQLAGLQQLGRAELVDYREIARIKRGALEPVAQEFFESTAQQDAHFRTFLADNPRVHDYAAFRAATEQQQCGWPVWPERLRHGSLEADDYDAAAARYHVFVQYACARQLERISRQEGARLYLDLPLGVHPDGFDIWRERDLFATGVSTGAPPDAFFTQGQNWGFPPLRPGPLRREGYAYLRDTIRTHLRYAGALRLDHVMALHRLFWVPTGMQAKDGVYVRYPAEELYAVLCLESQRHEALIIGEDLGTVPPGVREAMTEHNLARMYVVQFEVHADQHDPLPAPPPHSVVSLNTHDMPTFEAFHRALDADLRAELGLLSADEVAAIRHERHELMHALAVQLQRAGFLHDRPAARQVRDAVYDFLARGPACMLLVNLEDLWQEERPQNVPGTGAERPNWRRRTRPALEDILNSPEINAVLSRLNENRREH